MRAAALPAIAAVLLFTGCEASVGTSKTLNTGKAEKEILAGIEKQTGARIDKVDCPEDIEAKKGDTFNCKVLTADGKTGTVKVRQSDDEGNISWSLR